MLTLSQLTTRITDAEALELILTKLEEVGFAGTSWQEGSIQRTFFTGIAFLYAGLTNTVADIATSLFPKLATGVWQQVLGEHWYDLPIQSATVAKGEMVVSLSAAAAPASWAAGELVVADSATTPANSFRIQEAGSLSPGGSDSFIWHAESPGEAGNIPNNTTLFMWTPITGMTVTNPAISGTSTWLTEAGKDQESSTRYAERMIGRWSRLTYGNTEGAYRAWAFEALSALTRVVVLEGALDGHVRVIGATSTGGLTGGQITTISDYIHGVTDGVGRRPINDVVSVESATSKTTPTLNLTVTCDSAFAADAAGRVQVALTALFGALAIGGEIISPSTVGFVFASRIYSTIMALTGIRNVSGVPSDISMGSTEIYTPTINVTVIAT